MHNWEDSLDGGSARSEESAYELENTITEWTQTFMLLVGLEITIRTALADEDISCLRPFSPVDQSV
jgi:hypothetical protein